MNLVQRFPRKGEFSKWIVAVYKDIVRLIYSYDCHSNSTLNTHWYVVGGTPIKQPYNFMGWKFADWTGPDGLVGKPGTEHRANWYAKNRRIPYETKPLDKHIENILKLISQGYE